MSDMDELRREEYEADNPMCRAHRQRGCEECEARWLDEADDEINEQLRLIKEKQ